MEILRNFIVFEGLDGAGTTTQSKLLAGKIKNSFLTNEPTDGKIGKLIREALQKKVLLKPETLSYLFVADRNEHLYAEEGIINKCKNDQTVICDRYFFSTIAYQGISMNVDELFYLNSKFPLPQILFFLNTSINNCQRRINKRGESEELFENKSIQEKILNNYFISFEKFKNSGMNVCILDGNISADELLDKELQILKENNII
ncbi:MAG: dTMP kinase [Spirochaetes bacterium]|nr:dTMP kinase [Spirochaetota bacterium]